MVSRRFWAAFALLFVLLATAVPAYGATPAVDRTRLNNDEFWRTVPGQEVETESGVSCYYRIYTDYDNHCLYIAVSLFDTQVEPYTKNGNLALELQLASPKFSDKDFTFVRNADTAQQDYGGFASACDMGIGISNRIGNYWTADGNAYCAVALDKNLCGPLTVRLNYSCGNRGVLLFENLQLDYTLPEPSTAQRSTKSKTRQHSAKPTRKAKETTTKFKYTGTVPQSTKGRVKPNASKATKYRYNAGGAGYAEEQKAQEQAAHRVVVTDGKYVAGVVPTHRSTMADRMIDLAVALATAAGIAIVVGILQCRKAKQKAEKEKQKRLEEQEIQEYDE